jgi:DedD protein
VNDIIKQRLVGALILLALGVVFWPIIFVQPDQREGADQSPAPSPPAVVTEPVASPDATGLRASPPLDAIGESGETMASVTQPPTDSSAGESVVSTNTVDPAVPPTGVATLPSENPVRQEPPQALQIDNSGVPIAWTLQVATVSAAEKAEDLRRKLLEMNQKAYVTTVSSGGKTLFRVCVGPKFERAELEKLQAVINAKFGVNTMVVRYAP